MNSHTPPLSTTNHPSRNSKVDDEDQDECLVTELPPNLKGGSVVANNIDEHVSLSSANSNSDSFELPLDVMDTSEFYCLSRHLASVANQFEDCNGNTRLGSFVDSPSGKRRTKQSFVKISPVRTGVERQQSEDSTDFSSNDSNHRIQSVDDAKHLESNAQEHTVRRDSEIHDWQVEDDNLSISDDADIENVNLPEDVADSAEFVDLSRHLNDVIARSNDVYSRAMDDASADCKSESATSSLQDQSPVGSAINDVIPNTSSQPPSPPEAAHEWSDFAVFQESSDVPSFADWAQSDAFAEKIDADLPSGQVEDNPGCAEEEDDFGEFTGSTVTVKKIRGDDSSHTPETSFNSGSMQQVDFLVS